MSQSKSIPGDTPVKQNSAATGVFLNGTLDQQRMAVLNDLGNIPEVTVDFMLDHIVPNSGINVERTMQNLKRKGDLLNAGWKEFIGAMPKQSTANEQNVFSKMGIIYKGIIDSTEFDDGSSRTPTLVLGTSPDIAPISETNVRTRPDGCGQLVSNHPIHTSQCGYPPKEKGDYHWLNIAYVEEYKKRNSNNDLNDNVLKILWSLHHIMSVDRRRRFAFGITIENTDTRIWFCCRQVVFVTHRFDLMKEPNKLIRLISSLAYADVVKLGYDPTMKLFWKHDKWNYQITVKGKDEHQRIVTKVYRTIDIIADMSSNLRGRATRVYEAYDIENPNSRVVIKDSWADVNRAKEGDTLSKLLDNASDDEKAMFLTVLIHGVVTIDGREDLTQDLLMNGYLVSTNDESQADDESENLSSAIDYMLQKKMSNFSVADRGSVEDTAQDGHIYKASIFEVLKASIPGSQPPSLVTSPDVSTSKIAKQEPRVYGPKAHYRIVFKERGQSLHSLSRLRQINLPLVVQAMHDILNALAFLTRKGYVHRDISPGNIIIYNGRGKLSDLEFAKQYESGTSNHIRTGTYDYMAVEAETGAYIYYVSLVFSHNPLHDLESLWWVGVWILLCHYQSSKLQDINVQKHIKVVKKFGETLFNNRSDPLARRHALIGPNILAKSRATSFPEPVKHFILMLEEFRGHLIGFYERYKPKEVQDLSFFIPDVHRKFDHLFENAMKELRDDQTGLWPLDHIEKHITYLNARK